MLISFHNSVLRFISQYRTELIAHFGNTQSKFGKHHASKSKLNIALPKISKSKCAN